MTMIVKTTMTMVTTPTMKVVTTTTITVTLLALHNITSVLVDGLAEAQSRGALNLELGHSPRDGAQFLRSRRRRRHMIRGKFVRQ
jgi:hypothetical protein